MENDNSFRNYIITFLSILNYNADREKLAEKIERNIYFESFLNLANGLENKKMDRVIDTIQKEPDNINKISGILREKYSEEEIIKEIEKVSTKLIEDLLLGVAGDLSNEQKEKIIVFGYDVRNSMNG